MVALGLLLLLCAGCVFAGLPPRPGRGPAAVESVAELDREMEAIASAIRTHQGQGPAPESLAWPAPEHVGVSDGFGMREHPILGVPKEHAGVDITAPTGAKVVAATDGRVIMVEDLPAYGRVVVIDHGGQVATVYAHLSAVLVAEGQVVARGDRIGHVGATGGVTGPHLHFETRRNGVPADPSEELAVRP